MKKILILAVALILCFTLVGCGKETDKAKETAEAFLSSVANGDFENAKTYLHPDRQIDVEKYFNDYEARTGVDFQKGIKVKKYTGYSYSVYDSEVDGSEYELEMRISVGNKTLEINIDVVRNDNGYGIYEIDIDY